MAGTYLFRSFGLALPPFVHPGQAVLSEQASRLGPTLLETTGRLLGRIGVAIKRPVVGDPAVSSAAAQRDFLETQQALDGAFLPIKTRFAFSDDEAAYAVAAAVALLIRHCAKALDPTTAFAIAAFGFAEGTRTAPSPLERTRRE